MRNAVSLSAGTVPAIDSRLSRASANTLRRSSTSFAELCASARNDSIRSNGLSPRAGLALLHAARAWALMDGRAEVLPEDVQAVLPPVVGHRLHATPQHGRVNGVDVAGRLIDAVAIP